MILVVIHSVTLLLLAWITLRTVRKVSRIEEVTARLARLVDDQASLINHQAQMLVQITRELRR